LPLQCRCNITGFKDRLYCRGYTKISADCFVCWAIVSSLAIGATIKILDKPSAEMLAQGVTHLIGTDKYPAPQERYGNLIKASFR